ncbi:MAG TPA: asparagine synthase (glutamine-hydrolyzing) [Bryobacteraceae bacterium]|nr:asparagine synthase (glutamine-hydrolyzing) [Bryobacteraceae bacterium]
MCGIAGFTHVHSIPDRSMIRQATACIAHRGPDQSGTFETSVVSLGAVRLKIIDLGGGDQPMRTEDGNYTIVFNGEVYNHEEIRRELGLEGVAFQSRCDTEVVLRAYARWGTASFQRLRGMFAFAIWSERDCRLLLVRDRMGIKPLYYARRQENIYFGSELKTLFAHREIDRSFDPIGLNLYLSLNYIPGPHSMVEGIAKLPPGHWLEWQDGRVRTEPYWQLRFDPRPMSLEDAKAELDTLLEQSVAEHLVADVPLGVWSSGGLDSSTVVHYAARQVRGLKTFSVSFAGRSFDESRWFREIAAAYGTDHHEFDLNPEVDVIDAIQKMAYYSDEPSADAGALPVWYLSKMSRSQVTVALSGEGADELFGGYNTYLADGYAQRLQSIPAVLRRAALQAAGLLPVSDEKIGFEYKVKRMLEGSLLPPARAHLFWNGTASDTQRREMLQPEFYRDLPLPSGRDFLEVDQLNYLPDDILYKTDRMSMAHSLEVRPPFLDHRIVEFAARLPHELKIRGSSLKFVLRELMRDKLPASILTRKKEGFDIPAHHWLRTVLKPLLLDTVTRTAVERTGIFRWQPIESMLQAHLNRRANYGYHLWGLLTLFLWTDRWKVEAASRSTLSAGVPPPASVINS